MKRTVHALAAGIVTGVLLGHSADALGFDPLDTSNSFDFIILAHDSLVAAAQPLAADSSLRTCLVTSAEVLDAFGSDSLTIDDVKEFVEYAYLSWRIAPTYLLLVGDVATDADPDPPLYFGYLPSCERFNDWYPYHGGVYVDDGCIVTLLLLGSKPVMHVGRIPARDSLGLTMYVDKLEYYKSHEPETWSSRILFLTGDRNLCDLDHNEVMRTYADALMAEKLGAWSDVLPLYSADYGSGWPDAATQDTREQWDAGCGIINSFGQTGSECRLVQMARDFCAPGSTFVQQLGQTYRFPVMFTGSCAANMFFKRSSSNPNDPYCVGDDVLLSASDRGAVASYASCHAAPAFENYLMNKIFLDLFASKGIRDLGQLCTATEVEYLRQGIGEEFVAWQYCLLGDPTIQIKVPQCWECRNEDYWLEWRSGAEIEEPRVLQEIYYDDPFLIDHPNLRIVHADGSVEPGA